VADGAKRYARWLHSDQTRSPGGSWPPAARNSWHAARRPHEPLRRSGGSRRPHIQPAAWSSSPSSTWPCQWSSATAPRVPSEALFAHW